MIKISNLYALVLIFSAVHTAQSMSMPLYYLDANDELVRQDDPPSIPDSEVKNLKNDTEWKDAIQAEPFNSNTKK